jgi:hypothetical protein
VFDLALVYEGVSLVEPCLSLTLLIDARDERGVQDFYDKSRAALGEALRFVLTGNRKRPTRMRKWPELHAGRTWWAQFSAAGEGTSAATLTVSVRDLPEPTPALLARRRENWKAFVQQGATPSLPCTFLRVTFPLDHPLAQPERFLPWVLDLELIQSSMFATGNAGLALNYDATTVRFSADVGNHLEVYCTRLPGLGWHDGAHAANVLAWDDLRSDIVPRIKRTDWLVLVSDRTLAALDDVPRGDGILAHRVNHGVVFQAGPAPDAMGSNTYRALARALRPVRLTAITGPSGLEEPWATEWLEAFDRP